MRLCAFVGLCVRVCVYVCLCVLVSLCVCVCVCVCLLAQALDTEPIQRPNILPLKQIKDEMCCAVEDRREGEREGGREIEME